MNTDLMKMLVLLLLIVWSVPLLGLDKEEKSAIAAIKAGEIEALKSYLEKHPGVNCEFSNGKTGLYYAIEYDQAKIVEFLLKRGADPNYTVEDHHLLNWAIRFDRRRIIRFLIEYGAEVNKTDKNSDSPLIYAAKFNNLQICNILINRGADPLYKNPQEKKASDYAGNYYGSTAYTYLLTMEKQYENLDSIPSMRDGPYIFREDDDRIVMTYFEHDQNKGLTRLIEKTLEIGITDTIVEGFGWDSNSYQIKHRYTPDSSKVKTTGDIFVFGDIHGKYHALFNILMNNKIIDSNFRWIFGEGQLVLLGDEFDRGAFVTETFWFLYDLEIQARKSGGNVHVLLGNHEIMELTGDVRYLHDKYKHFTQYTGIDYFRLYEKNTVLGSWLRSKNIILQINDYLFMHAGISPQFALYDYAFSDINHRVRQYLLSDYGIEKGSPEDIILGAIGPLWYRGYGYEDLNEKFPEITQDFVDAYLEAKGLKKIILGHNEQTTITTAYMGKIVNDDVGIDETGKSAQGLLISGEKFFRCFYDGTREPIE